MAEQQLNLEHLMLEDGSYVLLEEGTYRFMVRSHSVDYYSGDSEKIPPNTQVVTAELEIPYTDETGTLCTVIVKNKLNVYQKVLFIIRQFTNAIGLTPEVGKVPINLLDMDGKTGICEITHREGSNGNTYNNVSTFYAPSKAPKVCLNDAEWAQWDCGKGLVEISDEAAKELPWS